MEYYRGLFETEMAEHELQKIRESTNKAWALGDSHFRDRIEELSNRRSSPLPKGRLKETG